MNFCKMMNFQLTPLSKIFPKPCMSAPSLSSHNSSTDLPAELLSAPLVWVRRGCLVPPLQPLYDGPYAVLCSGPRSFTIRVGSRDEVVAVSRLKACTAADATPGSPRRRGRPPDSRQGGLAATKRSHFQTRWSLHLPLLRRRHATVPGTVFLPSKEVFARLGMAAPSQPPKTWYLSCQQALPQRLHL
jgi:hypothetical protein